MSYTGTAILRWAMSTEADLDGYKIYQGPLPGVYTRTQAVGLITCSTGAPAREVEQITNGEPTYLTVTAYDNNGNESLFGAEVSIIKTVPLVRVARQLA